MCTWPKPELVDFRLCIRLFHNVALFPGFDMSTFNCLKHVSCCCCSLQGNVCVGGTIMLHSGGQF